MTKKKTTTEKAEKSPEKEPESPEELFVVAQMAATIYSTIHQRSQAIHGEKAIQFAVEQAIEVLHHTAQGLAKLEEKADAGQ